MIVKTSELKPNMMVIYKINYPNGKIYIGFATDLKRRMWEHNTPISSSLNKKRQICDYAIAKYGKITEVEILEFVTDIKQLEEREKYWIAYYNANNKDIGYNITPGGDACDQIGEDNVNAVFTNEQVLDIRKRRFLQERKKDVYKDYSNISFSTFEKVWLGHGYPNIGQEYLIPTNSISRQEYSSNANSGIKNGRAKCTIEQIKEIRQRYDNGESIASIAKDFTFVKRNTVHRIAHREVYKDVK